MTTAVDVTQMAYLPYELLLLYTNDAVSFHALPAFAAMHRTNQTVQNSPLRAVDEKGLLFRCSKRGLKKHKLLKAMGQFLLQA